MFSPNYLTSFGYDRYGFFVKVRAYRILSAYDNVLCFNVGESPPSLFCYA